MKPRVHESLRCGSASFQARRCTADERGSAAIELVLLVPALMLLLLFAVAGGRVAIAHGSVQQAAADAARAASIARTAGSAQTSAVAAARATLANQGLTCASMTVTLDTSGFATPVGTPGERRGDGELHGGVVRAGTARPAGQDRQRDGHESA